MPHVLHTPTIQVGAVNFLPHPRPSLQENCTCKPHLISWSLSCRPPLTLSQKLCHWCPVASMAPTASSSVGAIDTKKASLSSLHFGSQPQERLRLLRPLRLIFCSAGALPEPVEMMQFHLSIEAFKAPVCISSCSNFVGPSREIFHEMLFTCHSKSQLDPSPSSHGHRCQVTIAHARRHH